jgi:transcriptional regulator with XRE-family HTH domain
MLNIHKIETLIRERGWSNTYFASLFNKNKGWIRDMKRGRGLPDGNLLEQIADKLDTTVDYLTDQTDIKKEPTAQIGDKLFGEEAEILKMFRAASPELKAAALAMLKAAERNRLNNNSSSKDK